MKRLALLLGFMLALPAVASAQKGIFQIDAIQNERLDQHDSAIARIDAIIARLEAGKFSSIAPATAYRPATTAAASPGVLAIANNPRQAPWVETATGRTSDAHLIREHGYAAAQITGLSQAQKDRLHGHAHEHPRQVAAKPVRQVVVQSGCPGGVCPMGVQQRQRGRWRLFR